MILGQIRNIISKHSETCDFYIVLCGRDWIDAYQFCSIFLDTRRLHFPDSLVVYLRQGRNDVLHGQIWPYMISFLSLFADWMAEYRGSSKGFQGDWKVMTTVEKSQDL